MLNFEHGQWLYLLLGLIPLAGLFLFGMWQRKRNISRFADTEMVKALMPHRSQRRKVVRYSLLLLALASMVIGLANLRMGSRKQRVNRTGADVMIAFDLSKSMLAEDLKPNRLSRAKIFASKLLKELYNDKVGLVVFAGHAYQQMPLSVDARAGQMYLNILDTDGIPVQGTAIGEAISLCMEAFDKGESEAEKSSTNRVLIIITDGENHEDAAIEMAKEAADNGITIFTIGVGTPKGAPIPVIKRGRAVDYKKDKEGSIILSKLNEGVLQEIAAVGNGAYYHLTGGTQAIRDIGQEVERLGKEIGENYEYTEYKKHFQVFLAIALGLLLLEFLISDRKAVWFGGIKLFGS